MSRKKWATGWCLVCGAAAVMVLASCRMFPGRPAEEFRFLRADGTRTVDETGRPILLKGCNFGNWFLLEMWMLDISGIEDQYTFEKILAERFGEERKAKLMDLYRENWITDRDFRIARSFGFNVIRVPFHYQLLVDDARPRELRPDAFRWLDRAVAMAARHGLYVILDMHGAPGFQSVDHTSGRAGQNRLWEDPAAQEQMVWLWSELAAHYKDSPVVAAYEPVNEPFGDYKTAKHHDALAALMDRVHEAIRAVDERHIIIIPGTRDGFKFYGDPRARGWKNVMITEHYYPGVHGGGPGLMAHSDHMHRLLSAQKHALSTWQVPFLIGEFNVVFRRSGGPDMMRQYYDLCASNGWWATMWSYKIVRRAGGLGRDNWYMVTNLKPAPAVSIRTSTLEEIESYFRWFGTMDYAVYDELRQALVAAEARPFDIAGPDPLMTAPAHDSAAPWSADDIASTPAGGQRVHADGRMDIYGGGRDVWHDHDEFRFLSQEVAGDFDFEVTVTNLVEVNPYAKAGIMIRNGLGPGAAHVFVHVFPNSQVVVGSREADGENMKEEKFPIREFPIRLRLKRTGGQLEVFHAAGAEGWREAGAVDFPWLGGPCRVGLAVLSHDDRFLTEASFENICLTDPTKE